MMKHTVLTSKILQLDTVDNNIIQPFQSGISPFTPVLMTEISCWDF